MNALGLAAGLLLAGMLSACASGPAREDADAEAASAAVPVGETQRCLQTQRIRRMEMVGDHTMLFHMNRDEIWRNRLPRSCPWFNDFSKFLYEPRGGRLCQLDSVWELRDEGFGFQRGAACPLGKFDRITEVQAERLREMQQ